MREKAVLIQVDLQNLFWAARRNNERIDFDKVWTFFNERETDFINKAIVYMTRSPDHDSRSFEKKLKLIGYTLSTKEVIRRRAPEPKNPVEKWKREVEEDETQLGFKQWQRYRPHYRKTPPKYIYRQTDMSVEITIDCIDHINTFDKWILMSGDGDFAELCRYVQERGKEVEIWSFKDSSSFMLEKYANRVNFIEDSFFQRRVVQTFGFRDSQIRGE